MNRRKFANNVILSKTDLDALHGNTETAFQAFLAAISAGGTVLLLNSAPPTAAYTATVDMTVPDTYFAADGLVGMVASDTLSFPKAAGQQARIFAVLRKSAETAVRSVVDPVTGVAANASVEIGEVEAYRLEITTDNGALPDPPALDPDDVGYVEIWRGATDGATLTTDTYDPGGVLWAFPGSGMSTAAHAASHLYGADPVSQATLGASPTIAGRSSRGLLPDGDLETLRAAIAAVAASPACLSAVLSGDNNPNGASPRTLTLALTLGTGLVNASGALAVDGTVSRSGHGHSIATIGYHEAAIVREVDSLTLGEVFSLTPDELNGFTAVRDAHVFWRPSASDPMVEASWDVNTNRGARALVNAADKTVRVSLQSSGVVYLTPGELASVYPDSSAGPSTGQLVIVVRGEKG